MANELKVEPKPKLWTMSVEDSWQKVYMSLQGLQGVESIVFRLLDYCCTFEGSGRYIAKDLKSFVLAAKVFRIHQNVMMDLLQIDEQLIYPWYTEEERLEIGMRFVRGKISVRQD